MQWYLWTPSRVRIHHFVQLLAPLVKFVMLEKRNLLEVLADYLLRLVFGRTDYNCFYLLQPFHRSS